MNARVGWTELPQGLRDSIEGQVGGFLDEEPMSTGHNCLIGMRLHAESGTYFIKGVPADRAPAVRTQGFERMVSPYVRQISPPLAFHLDRDGWNVLGFRFLDGYRHADLTPGSADLPKITETLGALSQVQLPGGIQVRRAEQRYADYAGGNGDAFAGTTLCHTDLHKHNILVNDSDAKLVDWAWPTRGAPWLDTACVALQLIEAGHSAKEAEAWAGEIGPFRDANQDHVSLFVTAIRKVWEEVALADPQKWKRSVAVAASEWAIYRGVD